MSGWRDSRGTIFRRSCSRRIPTAPLITSVPTNDSSGNAYGLDFFLTRADGPARPRLTGWVSSSLSKTQQEIYGRRVPFSYDRRARAERGVELASGTSLGLAGTARAASGFPRTPPAGVRVATRKSARGWCRCRLAPNRFALEVAPGGVAELNSARMPMFARLDLRLAYRPRGGADAGSCMSRASTC